MAKNRRRSRKQNRCTSSVWQRFATIADLIYCRPGDTNRRATRRCPTGDIDFCVEQDAAQHLSEQYLFAKYTKKELEAWQSLVHVSTMEKCYFWVTTPPESATCLHSQNACKAHIGCLAGRAPFYLLPRRLSSTKRGQHHCYTRTQRSCVSNQPHERSRFAFGNRFVSDARAFPGADTSAALVG
jgi:hypothetical protein